MAIGSIRWAPKYFLAGLALLAAVGDAARGQESEIDHYILALSWQPAFCQYHPDLPECPAQESGGVSGAYHLTLHGLWPNDADKSGLSYCGVDPALRALDARRQWCEIPAPNVPENLRPAIDRIMPGTKSCLDRHEWLKHGTCSGLDQDAYFQLAAEIAADISSSEIGRAISAGMGGVIEAKSLRAAFERRFGAGSSQALSLRCRKDGGRSYLSALWVRLSPAIRELNPGNVVLDRQVLDTRGSGKDRSCPPLVYIDAPGL